MGHAIATRIEYLSKIMAVIGQVAIFLMFPTITADVFCRFVLNKPIPGILEIIQLFNVIAMTMSVAYVQFTKRHVYVDIVFNRMKPRLQYAMGVLGFGLGIICFGMLTWRLAFWSAASWAIRESTMGLITFPMYPVKMLLCLGCGAFCLMFAIDVVRQFRGLLRPVVAVKHEVTAL